MAKKVSIDYDFLASIVLQSAFPYGWKSLIPGYSMYKLLLEPLTQKIIDSSTLKQGKDFENIKEIIKSGKEHGVDEMEIKISKEAGINIGADLSEIGVPCSMQFEIGAQGETIISIKYK